MKINVKNTTIVAWALTIIVGLFIGETILAIFFFPIIAFPFLGIFLAIRGLKTSTYVRKNYSEIYEKYRRDQMGFDGHSTVDLLKVYKHEKQLLIEDKYLKNHIVDAIITINLLVFSVVYPAVSSILYVIVMSLIS